MSANPRTFRISFTGVHEHTSIADIADACCSALGATAWGYDELKAENRDLREERDLRAENERLRRERAEKDAEIAGLKQDIDGLLEARMSQTAEIERLRSLAVSAAATAVEVALECWSIDGETGVPMADDSPVMDDPVVASALRVLRGYKNSMHPADRAELIFALRDYGDMRRENAELRQGIREIDRKLDHD